MSLHTPKIAMNGRFLAVAEHPGYIAALNHERVVAVNDVEQSDAVRSLHGYCRRLRTHQCSMVWCSGRGARCRVSEHTVPDTWSEGEKQFVAENAAHFSHIMHHAQLNRERNRAQSI